MTADAKAADSSALEAEIAEAVRAAKLRLRFDKVVQRLSAALKAGLADAIPAGASVVVTVTAPIRHPAKTAEDVQALVRSGAFRDDGPRTIQGNQVQVREVAPAAANAPKVLVFVHNPDPDPGRILDIAASRLLQPG